MHILPHEGKREGKGSATEKNERRTSVPIEKNSIATKIRPRVTDRENSILN